MKTREAIGILVLITVATAARMLLAASLGLGVDESYAVAVAHPFSLSYYDHPPLVFWIAGAVSAIAGTYERVLLRLPFVLLFAGTTWMIFLLGRRFFGNRAGMYGAILLTLSPVFSLTTGGWVLPDGPLMFGLSLCVLCLSSALIEPATPRSAWQRWRPWLGAGCAAGIAALSKYHAVFLGVGALLYFVTTRDQRRWLARPQPYVAAAVALVLASPVFIWNAQHDWASFRFQLTRGSGGGGHHLASLAQNIGGQAGYILPWIWVPLVWVLGSAIRHGPPRGGSAESPSARGRWLLVSFAIPPIVVFTLISLGGSAGLPHWPAPGYLFLFPLLGNAVVRFEQRRGVAAAKRLVSLAAVAFVVLAGFAATQTATGWFSRAAPALFTRGDPSLEALDWSELRPALSRMGLLTPDVIVGANSWIDAAKLGYALGPNVRVVCTGTDPRQFRYSANARWASEANLLIVERLKSGEPAPPAPNATTSGTLVTVIPIHRGGVEVFRLAVYRQR